MTQVESKILFWQARVEITQAPEIFKHNPTPSRVIPFYQKPEDFRTFLYDPFGENHPASYGVEFIAGEHMEVAFFTKANSETEAYKLGNAWLSNLKYRFRGLDGTIKAKPIHNQNERGNSKLELLEIKLPDGLITKKINIIERFVNAFYYKNSQSIKLIIIWQSQDRLESSPEGSNMYKLRIFIICEITDCSDENYIKLRGLLEFLAMEIETNSGKRASVVETSISLIPKILEGEVFNPSEEELNAVVVEDVNFDFPENIPLPRLPILNHENVRYIDLNGVFKKEAIEIGNHIKNGVITEHITYVPINKLPQDMVIFGKPGCGKTYFLARFIKKLSKKAKNVGILVLNIAKSSQDIYFQNFLKVKYSDDEFHIPYFFKGKSFEKCLQETATYICASLGLKNVFEKIIYRTGIAFIKSNGQLPNQLGILLNGVESYVKNNPYGSDVQANLLQALRNRIKVFSEEKVQQVLQLTQDLPKWFEDWISGKKVFLDLSMCNKFTKALVINAILQLIRTITKDTELEELKHLIVIDEAHALLEKPITRNSDDSDFIMKEQLVKIFSELLKEYRSRGVGFVIADQSPARLFDDVASQPSIKIIFREDYPNNTLFSEAPIERQLLTQLANRAALVINGATGEKYLIKTLNYQVRKG